MRDRTLASWLVRAALGDGPKGRQSDERQALIERVTPEVTALRERVAEMAAPKAKTAKTKKGS